MNYYIGADLGTSALKLILADKNGNILKSVSRSCDVCYPKSGWSEQSPKDWWSAYVDGVRELIYKVSPDEIMGVAVAGQMHGLVVLDENDNVIRPAILWNDGRCDKETQYLNTVIGKEKLSSLTANIAFAGFTAPKLLWMKNNEIENFNKIKKIMLPKDYINYRLTGVHSTDYSDASGMLLLDVKNKCWSEEMLEICSVTKEQMPKLFESYDCIGSILPEVAKELGLSPNVKVAAGTDMFGRDTADKSFGAPKGTMEHAKAKVDAGFEFMQKLGVEYFCFHDVDLVPEADDINETNKRLDEITDYMLEKMNETGIKCLWGTANMFSNPRFMNGAGSTNSADVFCFAAAQIKKVLELTVKLGGRGYVFWGGREGYETLLNTDIKFEQENIARLMKMAVEYGRKIGFKGDFYIEPKPKEPMKHQYDFDAATAIGFLRQYGLDKDFKMNIEANHATLAGHTFEHELRISAINGMLGSIDANQGDYLLGWDTDEFPSDVYTATMCMYEVLKAGGLTGGFNFDAKNRRPSYTYEDMFYAFILAMDTYALGLIKASKLIEDGRIDEFVKNKYSSFQSEIGQKILSGNTTLEELSAYAENLKNPQLPQSGRQELLNSIVNSVLFK